MSVRPASLSIHGAEATILSVGPIRLPCRDSSTQSDFPHVSASKGGRERLDEGRSR